MAIQSPADPSHSTTPPLNKNPEIGVIMGSQSDWSTMEKAVEILESFGVGYDAKIVSAHRTPDRLYSYAREAKQRGLKAIIAGAGGAAHLPGMVAALTPLPVIGVPVQSRSLKGLDSLLSIVQMPKGIPVATVAIGEAGAANAGLLAVAMLAAHDENLSNQLDEWRMAQSEAVVSKVQR